VIESLIVFFIIENETKQTILIYCVPGKCSKSLLLSMFNVLSLLTIVRSPLTFVFRPLYESSDNHIKNHVIAIKCIYIWTQTWTRN